MIGPAVAPGTAPTGVGEKIPSGTGCEGADGKKVLGVGGWLVDSGQ